MKQTLLSNYATSAAYFTVEAPTIQYNSRGNPKNKQGRTPTYLTAPELKQAMQFYLSQDATEHKRLLEKYGERRLKHAKAISMLDYGTKGIISRHVCSFHGSKYLVYNWLGMKDGVRIRCFAVGGCSFNTHHDGYLYAGAEKQFESAEM